MSPGKQAFSKADRDWMRGALELARRGAGWTRPNPAVGCVIVSPSGEVLGEGYHHQAGLPHGEIEAIRDARARGNAIEGATFYVTMEPCHHEGRTPPCSAALIEAKPRRVVIGQLDPNPKAVGGADALRAAGIQVDSGLLEEEALLVNPGFNTFHLLKRPLVTLKWAMTLDGCTAVPGGHSKWITGEAARRRVHQDRAWHDAIMVGIGTLLKDDSRLTARVDELPPGPDRLRIVLDSLLRIPPGAAFFRERQGRAVIVCTEDRDESRETVLRDIGAEVWTLPRGPFGVSLPDLIDRLYHEGVQSLYVEGGRTVAGRLIQHGLADRVHAWIAPKLAGGGVDHLGSVQLPEPLTKMSAAKPLHNTSLEQFDGDLLMTGWLTEALFSSHEPPL